MKAQKSYQRRYGSKARVSLIGLGVKDQISECTIFNFWTVFFLNRPLKYRCKIHHDNITV